MALTETPAEPWIPADTFGARLALIRINLGLNITQAAERCDMSPENWRKWERGVSPRNMESLARQISDVTGADYTWLMAGGALSRSR